jgi:peptidyl-prolyl cis-trans isomerase SurA
MRRIVLLAILLQPTLFLLAGKPTKDTTLFNYGNKSVTSKEFYKGFSKNKDKGYVSKASEVDEYLELYKKFKLKVQDAYDQGLDTTEEFKTELATYRKQIAKPYLTDKVVNEQLVNEAYERMKYEVKASHILIVVRPFASPQDTLIALNKINAIRNKIDSGLSFENAAVEFSEDPSAQDNQGSLGYFTAFQMIYEFENYAFNTPLGKISKVFRTEFGYHIVKVMDKRLSKGEILVRQIKIEMNPNPSQEEVLEAEAKINEVYKKLQSGEKFVSLVQQYSEDASSVLKNGELPLFSMTSVRYPENFKNTAFSLSKDGDYSNPIQTANGFHILQRISLKPIDSLSKIRGSILNKISRDSRQYRNTLAVYEKAKKMYKFKENKKYNALLVKYIDDALLIGELKEDSVKMKSSESAVSLFALSKSKKTYTVRDFTKWLVEVQKPSNSKSKSSVIEQYYQAYRLQNIMEFYENDLENTNDTFAALYKEYKEGILLFTLTDKKVWSKSAEDTVGLKNFYNEHSSQYNFKDRYEATIYRCANKTIAESLKKDLENGLTMDSILKKNNRSNPLNVSNPMTGKYEQGNNQYANVIFNSGLGNQKYLIIEDPKSIGGYVVIVVHNFLPAGKKTLNEARGSVMSDYQASLEKEWIQQLLLKYPIVVNQAAFDSIKARMTGNK